MKQLLNQNGGITVFQCIVFFAIMIFTGVIVDASRIMVADRKVQSALNTSVRSVLAGYNTDLIGDYGLFGLDSNYNDINEDFIKYLKVNMDENSEKLRFIKYEIVRENSGIESFDSLLEDKKYKQQMLEYMKYRVPLTVTNGIIEKFTSSGLLKKLKFAEKEKAVRDTRNDIKSKVDHINEVVDDINGKGTMDLKELKDVRSKLQETANIIPDINTTLETDYTDKINEVKDILEKKEEWNVDSDGEKIENTSNGEFDHVKADSENLEPQIKANIEKLNDIITKIQEPEDKIKTLKDKIDSLKTLLKESDSESEKDDIQIKINDLKSEADKLREQIEELEENFKLEQMNTIRLKCLTKAADNNEKPGNRGEKEETKKFLDTLKGKLENYLDNKVIDENMLITQNEYENSSSAGKGSFSDMADRTVEKFKIYDNEKQSQDAESANRQIFSFLGGLFDTISDVAENGMEKLYTVEYIMDKYTYVTSKTERGHFFEKGEVEYILWGDCNQMANIIKTMGSIGFLRFSIDSIDYFATSKIAHPVIRLVYATGRGLVRSFSDVRDLYEGKKISICPSLNGKEKFELSYPDHLRLLLLMESAVSQHGQFNNMRQLTQVNIKQGNPDFKLQYCNTVLHGKADVKINLWFLPLIQVDKLGLRNFEDGKYRIRKEIYLCY